MSDDVSDTYNVKSVAAATGNDVAEMQQWMKSFQGGDQSASMPMVEPVAASNGLVEFDRPLPAPKPIRREEAGPMGAPKNDGGSLGGSIVRNVAEVPGQAVRGVHDAIMNATSWAIDPLANWLNDNVADLRYDPKDAPIIHDPKTPTGEVTRGISKFLTGFVPAIKALKAAGMAGAASTSVAAGAISDFSVKQGNEAKLSDLWNKMGLPKNVLTDYLSSKPEDSEIEGRFKAAVEGTGLGALTEGIFLAAKALKAARGVKQVQADEITFLRGKYGEVTDENIVGTGLGDAAKPLVAVEKRAAPVKAGKQPIEAPTIEARSLIRKSGAPNAEDFDVFVNFARFDEPDSVKFAIGKMAEAAKGTIDEATRGKITQIETEKMAEDLGLSVADLLARRKGQGFNAEEAVAARQLWAASGEKLVELAKKAAGKEATAMDHFAFRKMMATHSAIQAEVIGARTETARALASWAIPVKGGVERARLVDQVLQSTGGIETSAEMAKRLALLAESGASSATIGQFAFKGYASATTDAIKELWVNGLLSSPKTHVVNTFSNTVTAFQSIYERQVAGGINAALGGADGVQLGEAAAMAHGLIGGVKDSFRLAAQYLKTGQSQFQFNKVDILKPDAISPEAFNIARGTGTGRFLDYLGKVVGTPMHLLGAEDEFFKSIGYRMEVRAQALRTASQEGHKGEALAKRITELTDAPTEAIRINAADAALYNTFTSEMGAFGRGIMNLRNIDHPLNPAVFVMPFVRTPVNIARYAFERTPFAPLVSQWRADISAGGARADLALARMSTGTAIMLTAMDYADQGMISGDGPKGEDKDIREALMRQGWQPYSVKVGDRWYSYNRADPFGMTVGFAASIAESIRKGELDENDVDEWHEVTAMSIAAVSQVAVSKTYLEGFAKFVEVLADPKRYSENYVKELFASFLPATSLNAAVKNFVDPVQRESNSPIEAVHSRIVGLSENLPPKRNLWGEEINNSSGLGRLYDSVTPIASKPVVDSPIDREIVRIQDGPQRIGKKTVFDGVQANFKQWPKAYDDYVRLAGNELKHPAWQMGAKDYLNAVVSGAHPMSVTYNIMSDEARKDFINNTIRDYRHLAAQQVLADPKHAGFAREISFLKANKFEAKMPVMGDMK